MERVVITVRCVPHRIIAVIKAEELVECIAGQGWCGDRKGNWKGGSMERGQRNKMGK